MKENINQKEFPNTKKLNFQLKEKLWMSLHERKDALLFFCAPLAPNEALILMQRERDRWLWKKENIVCEWSLFVSVCLETLRGTSESVTTMALKNMAFLLLHLYEKTIRSEMERTIWFLSLSPSPSLFCVDFVFEVFIAYKYWSAVLYPILMAGKGHLHFLT